MARSPVRPFTRTDLAGQIFRADQHRSTIRELRFVPELPRLWLLVSNYIQSEGILGKASSEILDGDNALSLELGRSNPFGVTNATGRSMTKDFQARSTPSHEISTPTYIPEIRGDPDEDIISVPAFIG